MTAVLRFLLVIPLAFVLACFTAAFAMLWPFVDMRGASSGDPVFWLQTGFGFLAQAAQVGSAALVPWGIFMVAGESLGWRSLLLHVGAGLLGAFAVMRVAYGAVLPNQSVQTAIIVAGLSFALVYWILAGRTAGRWRRTGTPAAAPVKTRSETWT